ncbi:MAG: ABC transporter permease [Solirubrobacterales bacterium]|nr:ABC transporter permease [Solirubrobacterales bacterium]
MSTADIELPDAAPELRDVRGPSALGGGWRRSWDLLYMISTTEFKRTYFGTMLGYLWSLGRPLLLFGVLLAVFTQAFHLGRHVADYPVLLLMNIVLFGFFQEATTTAVPSIVSQEAIVRKTQFPRLVIPVAVVITSVFNLVLNLVVTFIFIAAFGVSPRWTWLLIIVTIVLLFVLSIAVAMILSSLYPRFRDLGIIWSVFATALFYATPVLYTLERMSATMRHLLALNPLAVILELARRWVIDPNAPTPAAIAGGTVRLLIPLAIYLGVCVAAVLVFRREAPRIAEAL